MIKMSNSNSGFKFAIGFILGMATGLAVAVLVAPQSGDETRKLLKEKIANAHGRAKDITDDVSGMVKEVTGDRKKIYSETWKQPKVKPYTEEL